MVKDCHGYIFSLLILITQMITYNLYDSKWSSCRIKVLSNMKENEKKFNTSEYKAQVNSQKEAWKREAMAVSAGKGTLLSLWKKRSTRKG